ncbi:MAG: GNAT family N-acetyltransferase [Thermoguttaceae bacterium]
MLRIRAMNLDDVPLGCRLNDAAGWNQLPADWQRLLALEPTGCFVAEWAGQSVGTACVTRFDTIAWISMVLVDAAYRGRGIGTQLMRHALAWLDRCGVRTVRLDATALGRPVYEKLGFVGEYEVARWEGTAAIASPTLTPRFGGAAVPAAWTGETPAPQRVLRQAVGGKLRAEITVAADAHLVAITALDHQATGTPRGPLLARLFAERPQGMRVAVSRGRITGYSNVRFGARARQVGPVIALDASSGCALLDAVLSEHQGQTMFLDVPLRNRPATQWAEARGLCIQRQFLRMVRGQPVADTPEQIWASFGPEKG